MAVPSTSFEQWNFRQFDGGTWLAHFQGGGDLGIRQNRNFDGGRTVELKATSIRYDWQWFRVWQL